MWTRTSSEPRRTVVIGLGNPLMADDGLSRSIRPVHTPFDGDTVFALATGERPVEDLGMLTLIGHMAADCLARAVARAVYHADTLGRFSGWKTL